MKNIFQNPHEFVMFDDESSKIITEVNDMIEVSEKQSEVLLRYSYKFITLHNSFFKFWNYDIADREIIEKSQKYLVLPIIYEKGGLMSNMKKAHDKKWEEYYPDLHAFTSYVQDKTTV